jgi:hypothetical protein
MINKGTRTGLAAAKERGVKRDGALQPINQIRSAAALARAQAIAPILSELTALTDRAVAQNSTRARSRPRRARRGRP